MWFKNKTSTTNSPDKARDMRAELGLLSDSEQAVRTKVSKSDKPTKDARVSKRAVTNDVYDEEVRLHDLKVRARRRLIGAAVLLVAAFVALPWIFDSNRKLTADSVKAVVPEKEMALEVKNPKAQVSDKVDSKNTAAVTATNSVAASNVSVTPAIVNPTTKEQVKEQVIAPMADKTKSPAVIEAKNQPTPPATASTDKSKDTSESASKGTYAVHIGQVTTQKELDALVAKLRAAGVEPQLKTVQVNGVNKTRVRLGVFTTQAEAEAAAAKARGVAKSPVVIPVKTDKP